MATGALIRDFEKDYRELRYSNSGSITLSEVEHNAYRAALTLEITHVDAPRYGSRKTLPDNTHYGYVTLFRGSTVTDTVAIKYPKFRVFDIRNQGIWNYHQSTESVQVGAGVSVTAANASSSGILDRLGNLVTGTVCFLIGIDYAAGGGGPVSDFVLDFFDCDEPDGETREISKRYRAFPIATPFPDIAKFKADIPCSFLWRLELWYLVNPAVYIVDSPTDTGDETEDEDEYPEPEQGDGDGDGDEFPDSDPVPPDSDPRDFPPGEIGPPTNPDGTVTYTVTVTALALDSNSREVNFTTSVTANLFPNGAPFVAVTAGRPVIVRLGGKSYFNGLTIKDRFGNTVITPFAPGVGYVAGEYPVVLSVS